MPQSAEAILTPLEHPSNQTFQVAIRKRTSVFVDPAFRDRGAEQRAHLTMKFVLDRFDNLGKARTKPSDADGSNGFLPRILIVGSHGKNLFEQHLRREVGTKRREIRATITAQNAPSDDRRGEAATRDTREERRFFIVKKRDSGKRGTQDYARVEAALDKGFVFTNDAKAGEGGDHVQAGFAGSLAHVGNNCFIGFKGDAFLQLPP